MYTAAENVANNYIYKYINTTKYKVDEKDVF